MRLVVYRPSVAWLAAALGIVFPASSESSDHSVCGVARTAGLVAEAIDGASMRFSDGRIVQFANVIAPLPIDGDAKASARSKAALQELAAGREVQILASDAKDRYGRVLAKVVLLDNKIPLETLLLERGVVRALPISDDNCMKALLAHERKALAAKAGIWATDKFRVFSAEEIELLLAASGRFAVVEGTIRRIGESRGRIYLDFGRRFTEDFTIIVPNNLRKLLAEQGIDPKNWRGRRIRVRGILFSWGGPAMEISLAQAIEFLDQEIPKSE